MSTHAITRHPIPVAAAGAAVAAVFAVGAVVATHHDTGTTTPGGSTSVTYPDDPWHPTTAGGRTQIGFP
jgi:hypothetical protein